MDLYNPENDFSVVSIPFLWADIVWFLPNSKQKAVACRADVLNVRLKNPKNAHTTSILSHGPCLPAAGPTQCPPVSQGKLINPSKTGCGSEVCLLKQLSLR